MKKTNIILIILISLTIHCPAQAAILFDNGSPSITNPTYNMTGPTFEVVDDFQLNTNSIISDIVYDTWYLNATTYTNTYFAIYTSLPAVGNPTPTVPLVSGTLTATSISNGLVNTFNFNNPTGFTHTLSGLSIPLSAGTYYLGLTDFVSAGLIAVANGAGGANTIGPGMYQYIYSGLGSSNFYSGEHMSFEIQGSAVPIPGAIWLLSSGLVGIVGIRKKIKR